jgi:uncharacterized damage-inducible protein DinB
MNRSVIEQYEAGGQKLQSAIAHLGKQDLLWKPSANDGIGLWSIHQIVIHLMDSDLIWGNRMKSIIAEENPTILGYDESKFAASLFYEDQNIEAAIELFSMNRAQLAKILRKLPDSAYSRAGQHNERGPVTLGQALEMMVYHVEHQIGFIAKKREKLGKPVRG